MERTAVATFSLSSFFFLVLLLLSVNVHLFLPVLLALLGVLLLLLGCDGENSSGYLLFVLLLLLLNVGSVPIGGRLGGRLELGDRHVQVAVEADDGGGLEGEREEVREGEPVPVLGEHQHPH